MKAGLQQIPIQGAAPRLAGNREWDGLPMPTRFWAILAVAFGVSLSVIDGAIANVALPTMARMLGISSANSIWIVNAYQLAIVVSLLSFSALGDVIGYRKIYIGGLGIFIVASLGCTLSDSLATLVTARVCQGFGAAAITSVNTTLIRLIYPRRHLGRGMGVNATVVAVSSVAGPTLASGILSIATWPWLFAINIPIGLIACLLSYRFLPKNPVRIRGRHFDWRDGLMNALTFGLLIASIEGYSHGLKPSYIGISVILLVLIGTLFVRSQLHKPYPILPFDLLRIPIFSVSVITSICSFIAQMLAMVALPFYLQKTFGYTEVHTGLILTACAARKSFSKSARLAMLGKLIANTFQEALILLRLFLDRGLGSSKTLLIFSKFKLIGKLKRNPLNFLVKKTYLQAFLQQLRQQSYYDYQ